MFQDRYFSGLFLEFSGYKNSLSALNELKTKYDCSLSNTPGTENYQFTCPSGNIVYVFDKITQKASVMFGSRQYTKLK